MTVAAGTMKRTLVVFVLLATATAIAQDDKNPVTSVVKGILPRQQKNLVAAAEEMPADKFGFRPTPEQMTFGNLVLHIIQSNSYLCAKIGEIPEAKSPGLKETDGKDRLVTALKASFDFCSTALAKVDDSKLGRPLQRGCHVSAPKRIVAANSTRKEVKRGPS